MTSTNDAPEPNDLHRATDRTGLLNTADAVIIYDRENAQEWIQSDESVSLADWR